MSHSNQYHSDSDSDIESIKSKSNSSDSESEFPYHITFSPNLNKKKSTKMTPPQTQSQAPLLPPPKLEKNYLDMIPDFHGDSKLLSRFLEICEKLVNKFYNLVDVTDFQNEFLMSSILSKIKGDAAVNIASTTITRWDDLKQALLNTYSDKRDLYTLNIEITEIKQGSETAFEFYNRVQDILNLQISYINNQVTIPARPVLNRIF